ncbi:hypothetical protein [Streptococcus parasanguinis]|uniref:hypothetical protein n=1 Tax=Streptococcus parasanguinis TaxID=1318 RepID=UPI0007795656|nr:hypothetical protein [Streptococcus parasanguinis]MCY7050930.1 hypothetical protein [Streptococcus parasanguinis]MDB8626086.1 hypothetical protein [Streptococcus parasanguinis]
MSEKDQEQFMKHTPLDGAPHFDVAAPVFVPKEEAEDLKVPESEGTPELEATDDKEELKESAISETVEPPKVDEATVGEHSDVVAASQPAPPFQPAPQAPQNTVSEPVSPQTVPVPETPIPQAPLSPVGRPMDTADKKAIRFALGILVGLLIGGVSGYLIGHASPSTSSSRKQTSWSGNQSGSSSNIDLEQLTAEDAEANFSWEQSDIEQLQFLTGTDDGETPEEMVDAYGKASSVQFDSGELKLFWDDSSYSKEVKATFSKKGKQLQFVKFEFNQFGKNLTVEDNFADGFKVGNSETGAGGTSYKELLEKYGDAVNLTVSSSDDSDKVEMLMDFQKKNGDYVDLTFIRQENGDFLLSSKDSY